MGGGVGCYKKIRNQGGSGASFALVAAIDAPGEEGRGFIVWGELDAKSFQGLATTCVIAEKRPHLGPNDSTRD